MVLQIIFSDLAPVVVRVPAYVLPFLLWASFRTEAGDAALMMAAISVIAVWNSAHGLGPYTSLAEEGGLGNWVLRVQGGGAVMASTVLLLSAVIAERKRATTEHSRLVGELQQALAEIKTLQGMIPICACIRSG